MSFVSDIVFRGFYVHFNAVNGILSSFKNGSEETLLLNTIAAKLLLTTFNRITRPPMFVRFTLDEKFGLELNIKIVQNFTAPGGATFALKSLILGAFSLPLVLVWYQ